MAGLGLADNLIQQIDNNDLEDAVKDDGTPTVAWPTPKPEEIEEFKANRFKELGDTCFSKKNVQKNALGIYLVKRCGEKDWENSPEFIEYLTFEWIRKTQRLSTKDFQEFRTLGRGAFGMVQAVKRSSSGILYANKIQSKGRLKANKAVGLAFEERKCLSLCRSKFIVKLHYAFQDKSNIYLILELLTGGDLSYQLSKHGKFSIDMSVFYLACIVEGLGAIHDIGWVYRDLKPENILLTKGGYCKLTDLGLATKVAKGLTGSAGTRGFFAPEMITKDKNGKSQSYDQRVDFFSLGCVAYAFFDGDTPFNESCQFVKDYIKEKHPESSRTFSIARIASGAAKSPPRPSQNAIFNDAVNEATRSMTVAYDEKCFSSKAESFCKALLEINPDERLGGGPGGWKAIENHALFDGFNFDELRNGSMRAPFVPSENVNAKDALEIGDHDDENEKLSEEDNAKFKKWNHVDKDLFYDEVVRSLKWAEKHGDLRINQNQNAKSSACAVM